MDKNLANVILEKIKPSQEEIEKIAKATEELKSKLKKSLGKHKIDADIFVGGSIAKNTIIRKGIYDIDIFIRFSYKKYSQRNSSLSDMLEKMLYGLKYKRIHGSRDYFHVHFGKAIKTPVLFELIPVLKIAKPQEAKNVTDLSSLHVNYISKKINERLADEIRIAKAFCYAQNCYGAESYIKGFSGYALELIVIHFGSFINFLKEAIKWQKTIEKKEKIVIDMAKHYKNSKEVLVEINESKLLSPIIVVDPTYAIRNVTAAVSEETLSRLIKACKAFISKQDIKFFEKQGIDKENLKKIAARKKAKLAVISAESKKAKEDIAAAKLAKFSDFLVYFMEKKEFKILHKEIEFKKNKARIYLIYKKPPISGLVSGPPINLKEHAERFKIKYKKIFVKKGKLYAKVKNKAANIRKILDILKKGSEVRDMNITNIKLLK